jgi:hypothetical protein
MMIKRLRKKLTFHVPEEERQIAWRFLNENFRDETGSPKYFDYLSVESGPGIVTITIYKKDPVEYILFKLHPKWYMKPNIIRGIIFQNWKKIKRERGFYGYT